MPIRNPPPTADRSRLIETLKERLSDIEASFLELPNNRERSLALTNLEQASMWATKAILEGGRL